MLMRKPADAKMLPEVSTVGNAKFSAPHIALLISISFFKSMYRLEMTMA